MVARVPHPTAELVDETVRAAAKAAAGWAATSLSRRTAVLLGFRELVHAHRDELAEIVTREHGKVLSDAAGEVQRGLEVVEFACGLGQLLKGEMSAQSFRRRGLLLAAPAAWARPRRPQRCMSPPSGFPVAWARS